MTTPKPWTYYNDNNRCGIVLSVDMSETDDTNRSLAARVQLAQHGDILCVSTDDPLVKPGAPAYCLNLHDMRSGWISMGPHVLLAGTFVETKTERDASGNRLVAVKLGGNLFPAPQAWVPSELLALEDALRTQPQVTEQELHTAAIWSDTPTLQSVESTQALAFMRYVTLNRKLRDMVDHESAVEELRQDLNTCWNAMTHETRELAAWAIADVKSTPHEQTYAAARETQAPTEPEPRALVLRPLDEPSAAYWRAIQTTRDTMHEAIMQLTEARRLANTCDSLANIAWYGAREVIDGLAELRKQLPDMPTTSAALDGGCANDGESGC